MPSHYVNQFWFIVNWTPPPQSPHPPLESKPKRISYKKISLKISSAKCLVPICHLVNNRLNEITDNEHKNSTTSVACSCPGSTGPPGLRPSLRPIYIYIYIWEQHLDNSKLKLHTYVFIACYTMHEMILLHGISQSVKTTLHKIVRITGIWLSTIINAMWCRVWNVIYHWNNSL